MKYSKAAAANTIKDAFAKVTSHDGIRLLFVRKIKAKYPLLLKISNDKAETSKKVHFLYKLHDGKNR